MVEWTKHAVLQLELLFEPSSQQVSLNFFVSQRIAAMSCVICLSKSAEIACIPCGHLCACSSCLPPAKRLPVKLCGRCPVCREVTTVGLRVFFSGAVINEPQVCPPELPVDQPVDQSPKPAIQRCGALLVSVNFIIITIIIEDPPPHPQTCLGVLRSLVICPKAICDHSRADEELWDTVLAAEDEWMRVFPDPKDLPVEDCIDLLAVTVSEQVSELKDSDYKAYAEGVMNAIEKNWRAKALRLHPDKIDGPFWNQHRKERLGHLFNYYNTAQEELMKAFAQYSRVYGRSL